MVVRHSLVKIILMGLALYAGVIQAAVTVSIDRNPVHVNESFQLFFETREQTTQDPDFSPLQQLFVVLGNSQNNSISIINGNYKKSTKWTLQVMAKQIGDFVVPAIHFGNEKSDPFKISVKPASQSRAPTHNGLIFELEADKSSLYVQSQLIVTLRLMSDTNIAAYEMGRLHIEDMDVVIEPLGDVSQYQTRIADRPYLVLEKRYALFPQQSGRLNIQPVLDRKSVV